MAGLSMLRELDQTALTHREEMLVENEQIFAGQYRIDWEEENKKIERQRRYEIRMGVE